MKVVYLSPSGQLGGAEKALLDILASLKDVLPTFRPHLIVSSGGPLVAKAEALGAPVTIVPFPPALARLGDWGAGGQSGRRLSQFKLIAKLILASIGIARYLILLRRTLRTLSPDLIHTNGFKMHLLGLWARHRRIPIVWHIHDYVSARPMMARLMRNQVRRCAAVFANSQSVANDFRQLCGEKTNIHTVHNGVDLNVYSPYGPRVDIDALAGLPPSSKGVVKIGLFATMARWKGHEVFLRAISLLPLELPIRAYIVGDALYQTDGSQYSIPELRGMAESLGVADRIGFTGFIAEPASAMRACDIVVHASTRPEPFGLVIIEAMACGRAVIASQGGGAAELIKAGENALSHSPGDANEMAEALVRLAVDPTLCARLGKAGRTAANSRFNRKLFADKILPIYYESASSTQR
jgi:glycosyltransferase involved in cell wall biosynthesis